jgi:small-conductance mechanosensitive channel
MTLKEFLNYALIDKEDFDITVYEVLISLLVLVIASLLIRALSRIFRRREEGKFLDPGRSHAIFQVLKYVIWVAAILIAFETIGIKLTLLLAGSAALLVGLGLGLQEIFKDIMSGVAILFEGSLKVGDVVEIQEGLVGKVVEIGLRTSKIETRDNIVMVVPNSKFVTDIVINWSHIEKRTRFHVDVGVAYGSDVDKVTRILLECAQNQEKISSSPKPFVRFNDFGDSSLDFQLFFWSTETFRVEFIKSEIRYKIDAAFRAEGVHIPFPQRDVHIKSQPPGQL